MAVGAQIWKGPVGKLKEKKFGGLVRDVRCIVKNNTCKECSEFLHLTSVWLIQTSLLLHNLSDLLSTGSVQKQYKFFLFSLGEHSGPEYLKKSR